MTLPFPQVKRSVLDQLLLISLVPQGDEPEEHKTILPDGDLVGQPLVYNDKKWLVCLIQPCVKTKFSGMVMEQRVDNIQVGAAHCAFMT